LSDKYKQIIIKIYLGRPAPRAEGLIEGLFNYPSLRDSHSLGLGLKVLVEGPREPERDLSRLRLRAPVIMPAYSLLFFSGHSSPQYSTMSDKGGVGLVGSGRGLEGLRLLGGGLFYAFAKILKGPIGKGPDKTIYPTHKKSMIRVLQG